MPDKLNLFTHNGLFHADDVFAAAMLSLLSDDVNIVRGGDDDVPEDKENWIIFDIGGGLKNGAQFKAVQIGGPSGGCLILDQLDAPLDFDSVKKLDAIMGSGGLVVMDENTCMVEVARFFMNFTQRESCGKCVPCREGTKRMLEILERIVDGKGEMSDLDELEELAHMVQSMALCGLGKSAPLPVISTLNRFRDEYVEHIRDKKCHAKVCTALRQFHINQEFCIGCGKCVQLCPLNNIRLDKDKPVWGSNCTHCMACICYCPKEAIEYGKRSVGKPRYHFEQLKMK